jgi:two-component system, cell cycle sensor histidine kinase and response regulator CckA
VTGTTKKAGGNAMAAGIRGAVIRTIGEQVVRPLRVAIVVAILAMVAAVAMAALVRLGLATPDTGRLSLGPLAALTLASAAVVVLAGLVLAASAKRDALLRQGLDALPIAHVISDGKGRIEYANPASRILLPGESGPLTTLRQWVAPDEAAQSAFDRIQAEAACGGAARAVLHMLVGGVPAWFDISVLPLASGGRVLWRIEDVTVAEAHRRQAAAERDDLNVFFDQAPVGLYALDETGRFLTMNQVFAGWLGASATELVANGARLQSFIWSDSTPRRVEFDPLAAAQGVELSLRGAGGVPVDIVLDQIVRVVGDRRRTVSVVRNIGLERLAGSHRSSRERFQRFFELAPVGIALIDESARFMDTNRALDELLTDSRELVLGHGLLGYIADDALAEVKARLAAISAGEQAARPIETRLKGPGGKTVALFVSRLEAADRTLAGLILHFIDLTEQKKLEVQFAQSQKMQAVGQLAGGVAHDFNNLLTAMIGFCDLLLLRFRPGDQSFADIMQIKQNANRAANLVRQLLAFSRQQTLQPRVIQIGEVLAELSHLLNRLLGENVELKVVHGRNLGPVRVDQGQLEQVIINLAVNARDAMPKGGTLTIRTANLESKDPFQRELELMPAGAYVLIEVTDDGTGIPHEIIGRIFEPFFSTKEVGSGTGLGLSTVYGIVKQTGGFIFVESEIGKGTRFSIYLPRHETQEAAGPVRTGPDSAEPRVPADLTGAGVVLLVEDEDPVRMFSARALRNKGYTVLEAKSGEAALKIIASGGEPIDLIITDVVMPRMDGPTLIKQVREAMPEVKVIFISGYTEDTFRKRLDNEQGIHFLAKPFSLKQLATKVKEVMTGGEA